MSVQFGYRPQMSRGVPAPSVVPRSRIPKVTPPPAPVVVSPYGIEFTYGFSTVKLPTMMDIVRATAAKHQLKPAQILGESRSRDIVIARWEAMWLCEREKRWSIAHIGRTFGKDHTTVLNGVFRYQQRLDAKGGA